MSQYLINEIICLYLFRATEFENKVVYDCDIGYELIGEAQLTCLANKSYSAPRPVCNPVSCGNPKPIANGEVDFSGTVISLVSVVERIFKYNLFALHLNLEKDRMCLFDFRTFTLM